MRLFEVAGNMESMATQVIKDYDHRDFSNLIKAFQTFGNDFPQFLHTMEQRWPNRFPDRPFSTYLSGANHYLDKSYSNKSYYNTMKQMLS